MRISEFIEEIKNDFSEDDSVGLIDEISIFKWVLTVLQDFGQNIQDLHQVVAYVKNGKAILPDNFSSLYFAGICDNYNKSQGVTIEGTNYQWIERDERIIGYNSCRPCCLSKEDKIVTEKIGHTFKFETKDYSKVQPLTLGKYIQRDKCSSNCKNIGVSNQSTITIREKTALFNFEEGEVVVVYYGTPVDEDGEFIIPEIGHSVLIEFLEYYVKAKLTEKKLGNNDVKNGVQLFQYYDSRARDLKEKAYGVTKFLRLTPNSFKRLKQKNRVYYQLKQGLKNR